MTDDTTITKFAQGYRLEAAAVLVQIAKDESAPAASRVASAERILAYSDGKPSQARSLTVADVGQMTPELRRELLHALLVHYQTELPSQFQALIKASVDEALAQQTKKVSASLREPKAALPRPNRFTRRAPVAPRPETGRRSY